MSCDRCGYAANVEKAGRPAVPRAGARRRAALDAQVATPGQRTVEEVSAFLGVPPDRFVKTLLYVTDGGERGRGAGARRPRAQRGQAAAGARRRVR